MTDCLFYYIINSWRFSPESNENPEETFERKLDDDPNPYYNRFFSNYAVGICMVLGSSGYSVGKDQRYMSTHQ